LHLKRELKADEWNAYTDSNTLPYVIASIDRIELSSVVFVKCSMHHLQRVKIN